MSAVDPISSSNPRPNRNKPGTLFANSDFASAAIDFSQVPHLFKGLRQLQTTNPAEFQQVLTGAATQLKTAAAQTVGPRQSAVLNNLAAKFQHAAERRDLSTLQSCSCPAGVSPPPSGRCTLTPNSNAERHRKRKNLEN